MTRSPLSFVLHIGAHKTATTHLQNSLAAAAGELSAAGVMFYGPRDFRWGRPALQEMFNIGNRPEDEAPFTNTTALSDLTQGAPRLVISEENFGGTFLNRHGKVRAPLYPDLPRRLALLAERTAPLDVVLSIRNPAAILNSAYSQTVLAEQAIPLARYLAKNSFSRVNWVDLAARVLATKGVRTLTLWRQEDYGALFGQITRRMIGPGAPAVRPIPGRMHQGLTAAAVAATQADPPLPVQAAMEKFPAGPDTPGFDAFDAAEHALSDDYYAEQIATLDAMPRLTLLRPT